MSDDKEKNEINNDEQQANEQFANSFFNLISSSPSILTNPYWLNNLLKLQDTRPEEFKRENIQKWIKNPGANEKQLRQLNQYFLNTSEHYKRIVYYFASMLTFDHLVVPLNATKADMKTNAFKKNKAKVDNFLEDFKIKDELGKIMRIIMGEEVYFGYIRDDAKKFTIQKMPSQWCKLIARTEQGYQYAFDMTYLLLPSVNIDDYPPEFRKYKEELQKGESNTGTYWVILDPDKAFAFKFDETIASIVPPLLGLFLDVLEINEYKDLIKTRAMLDSYLLLHQRIPMSTDKSAKQNSFMIDSKNAVKFHNNTKKNLPQGVEIVTTPMDIQSIKIEGGQNKDSIVGIAEKSFFRTVGVSSILFGDETNSAGIKYSMQTDESFVIHMYRQFERWLTHVLERITGKHNFKIIFPDITYYNRQDKQEQFLQSAQYGFPKSLYAASLGVNLNDINALSDFEDSMDLNDKLVPLKSTHTDAANGQGRPQKAEGDLSEAGAATRDNGGNEDKKAE